MKFKLEISMDNAATNRSRDLAPLLRKAAEKVKVAKAGDIGRIMDYNGNTVGKWHITDED